MDPVRFLQWNSDNVKKRGHITIISEQDPVVIAISETDSES